MISCYHAYIFIYYLSYCSGLLRGCAAGKLTLGILLVEEQRGKGKKKKRSCQIFSLLLSQATSNKQRHGVYKLCKL